VASSCLKAARLRHRPRLPASLLSSTTASARPVARLWASSTVRLRIAAYGKRLTRVDAAFLYQSAGPASAFNDVTIGKNVGASCDSSAVAFNAQKGWDPTTGVLCQA
jgi:hypothetical protein